MLFVFILFFLFWMILRASRLPSGPAALLLSCLALPPRFRSMYMCICVCIYIYIYAKRIHLHINKVVRRLLPSYVPASRSCLFCLYIYIYIYIIQITYFFFFSDQHAASRCTCIYMICGCHPCAGAMLIFSVSFQF